MMDAMKKAFNDAVEKIENVYEDVDRIRMNVNIEAKTVRGKERDAYLDYMDILDLATEMLSQARFLVDYVKRKKS